jgi:hypothetical protein
MSLSPDIVELEMEGDPPNAGRWIMIVLQDEHSEIEIKHHSRGVTIMAPPSMESEAMEAAKEIVQKELVSTIYVRRDANAATNKDGQRRT